MLQAEVIAKAKDPEVTKSKLCTRGQSVMGKKQRRGHNGPQLGFILKAIGSHKGI